MVLISCVAKLPRFSVNLHRFLSTSFVRGPTKQNALLTQTFPKFYEERIMPEFSSTLALVSTHETPNPHNAPRSTLSESNKYLRWSFEDMHRHASALARGMVQMGVRKGDRVGVVMGNTRCVYISFIHQSCMV